MFSIFIGVVFTYLKYFSLSPLYLFRQVCIRSPANDLKLKMVTGYLNESSDPYLDNFQSNLIFTTCQYVAYLWRQTIPLHSFHVFFSLTLDDPVL